MFQICRRRANCFIFKAGNFGIWVFLFVCRKFSFVGWKYFSAFISRRRHTWNFFFCFGFSRLDHIFWSKIKAFWDMILNESAFESWSLGASFGPYGVILRPIAALINRPETRPVSWNILWNSIKWPGFRPIYRSRCWSQANAIKTKRCARV